MDVSVCSNIFLNGFDYLKPQHRWSLYIKNLYRDETTAPVYYQGSFGLMLIKCIIRCNNTYLNNILRLMPENHILLISEPHDVFRQRNWCVTRPQKAGISFYDI